MTLDGVEFLRRFLLHVLPKRFVRIRHFGFLANRARKEKLALCRVLIAAATGNPIHVATSEPATQSDATDDRDRCPYCATGRLIRIAVVEPDYPPFTKPAAAPPLDSS